MKTRNIDYTGCHPEIAEALKQNKMIECWVWDSDTNEIKKKKWVSEYRSDNPTYHYGTGTNSFVHAEPVDSWFPEKGEPVLCWNNGRKKAYIMSFNSKCNDDGYAYYVSTDCRCEAIRRVIYHCNADTVKALKLVSIPIKDWPKADEGDINP